MKQVIPDERCQNGLNISTFASSDHQSIYIGVPVPRGYRRKRRRRRSSREASDMDRNRHYSQHRHHEDSRYRDVDVEEGLTDSNEQSLHHINHAGKVTSEGPGLQP